MKLSFLVVLSAIFSFSAFASDDVKERYPFDSDRQETLFHQLTKELRCPKCLNQNIADSNAGVAMDLKNKTYQLVKEGKSKDEVIDFMVDRYGTFVTYQPPVNAITIWLWLFPVIFAISLLGFILKRSKKAANNKATVSESALEQAKKLLEEKDK